MSDEQTSLVDALADVLAESAPAALDDTERLALVRAALAAAPEGREDGDRREPESSGDALVDAAAEVLRASEPDALEDSEARALVARAFEATEDATTPPDAEAADAEVIPIGGFAHLPLLAAAAVILFVVAAAALSAPGTAPPEVHRFASGHRIVVAPGTVLDWDDDLDGLVVRIESGEAMFDVAPEAEQSVRVVCGGVSVRVTGTVFTVARRGAATRVAVFEGRVAVAGGGPLSLLSAGDRWEGEPGRRLPDSGASFEPRLVEEARWAAERRLSRAAPVDDFVPNLPPVPDLAADGRLPRDVSRDVSPESEPDDDPEAGFERDPSAGRVAAGGPPRMADARSLLTERRYADARLLADRALRGGVTADWLLIRGDALRGEGSLEEAAAEYTRAALVGDGRDRAVAGLSAARVLGRELGRGGAAREVLVTSGALDPGSPVHAQAAALAEELGVVVPRAE